MSTTTPTLHDLYRAANDAEDAWTKAIREAFPNKRAGDVRYTAAAKGEPGTPLRAAHDARDAAVDAWRVAARAATAARNA